MKKETLAQIACILAIIALIASVVNLVSLREKNESTTAIPGSSDAFEQILDSGKLRVAYVNYPPGCSVDSATGEVSGIFIDILEEIATGASLELEWVEEVGWGTMIQGLDANRYDLIASPVWANPARGKLATLSQPVYYSGIGVWVRPDDERFDGSDGWDELNAPGVRIAAMDGSTPEVIARTQFPDAELVSYPDLAGEPQLFLDVVAGKADVFFAEPSQGLAFLENNPGKLVNVAVENPIRVFPNVYMTRAGEFRLRDMLNVSLMDLQNRGVVDEILERYEESGKLFYRVATPFE
ncbi:MAG: ABC transporter substrate-binding protein [Planctomycetota bacterium]